MTNEEYIAASSSPEAARERASPIGEGAIVAEDRALSNGVVWIRSVEGGAASHRRAISRGIDKDKRSAEVITEAMWGGAPMAVAVAGAVEDVDMVVVDEEVMRRSMGVS